ncbi:MFS transporter [Rhodoplanes roseus]|uniref:MFS transporter n=1 Tax=Rhodoplanes roseus TaxID=29409 RepID=A0A327L3C3_9BRAD|nr:MFS transporter [Rhodoplanes roseus]RAI44545.1 MFS transporter [Rhodoplanes roseus]
MAKDEALYRKIAVRLIPFMMVLYLVAFLDRVNVSFAALTMNAELGLSPAVYGWGAGVFFLGYFLFEVPSNLVLERVGARVWIARIMITWGLVSAAMAFVQGPTSFYALRFLLGVAEAGFLPGMILYLTYWFPQERLARFVGLFMMAVPLASAVGAPLSSLVLSAHGWLGLSGWQWLFIIEGLPACALGLLVLALLPDGPDAAPWLSRDERAAVAARLAADRAGQTHRIHAALRPAMADPRVWLLGLAYFGIVVGLYGVGMWLPQLVRGLGFSIAQVGLVTAVPYLASAAAMLLWGRHSDRKGERVLHVALPTMVSAAALFAAVVLPLDIWSIIALGVATVGIYATLGPFWGLPPIFLTRTAAAGGIALINAVGNLGGFLGPTIVGWSLELTGSVHAGLVAVTACLVLSVAAVALAGRRLRVPAPPAVATVRS